MTEVLTCPLQTNTSRNEAPSRIAFVQASWHRSLLMRCQSGFLDACHAAGLDASLIDVHAVPGVFELPLRCKQLAETGRYAVLVAAGLITDGRIYRHDFVAASVNNGLMDVQLATGVPIVLSVLTPQRNPDDEAFGDFLGGHLAHKGAEAASVAMWCLQREPIAAAMPIWSRC